MRTASMEQLGALRGFERTHIRAAKKVVYSCVEFYRRCRFDRIFNEKSLRTLHAQAHRAAGDGLVSYTI